MLRNVASRHVASCRIMSRHVTSCHVMSRHVTSCHVISRHVTSCHVMSRHVMSRHVTSCHVMSRHVTSCHVMYLMSRHVVSRNVTSCHVTSCHVMSHLAVLPRPRRGTVTRPTLHCQLSTRNQFKLSMTVFVGCPEGCRYNTASAVYDLVNFHIFFTIFMFLRSGNPLLTLLRNYLVWLTSNTSRTGSCSGFSRSPIHGS